MSSYERERKKVRDRDDGEDDDGGGGGDESARRTTGARDRGEEGNDSARLPTGFDTFIENYATVTAATVVSSAFFESLRNRSIALPSREFSSIKGAPSRAMSLGHASTRR